MHVTRDEHTMAYMFEFLELLGIERDRVLFRNQVRCQLSMNNPATMGGRGTCWDGVVICRLSQGITAICSGERRSPRVPQGCHPHLLSTSMLSMRLPSVLGSLNWQDYLLTISIIKETTTARKRPPRQC